MRLKPLAEQVVVIMGASSGIGRAAALRFAALGARVVCSARSERGLCSLIEEIAKKGGLATAVVADVADAEQTRSVAQHAVKEFGRIDTWIHLAASTIYARVEETRPAEFARVLHVNLLGQIHGALAALPYLRREGRGALIHVSSVEAKVALPYQSAYAASKHGMVGFLDSLRLELLHEGVPISVTNIMPSTINTPIFAKALSRLGVEPRGAPPVYQPEVVVRALVHAAQHPVRDLVVGGAGRALLAARWISAHLTDAVLLGRIGFLAQRTDRPRSPHAPNDLYRPTEDRLLRIHGEFGDESLSRSLSTRLATSAAAGTARQIVRGASQLASAFVDAAWFASLPRAARAKLSRRPEGR